MPITQKWLNQMSTYYIFLKSEEKNSIKLSENIQGAYFPRLHNF